MFQPNNQVVNIDSLPTTELISLKTSMHKLAKQFTSSYHEGTQSADRGPEPGPPKGSQWTAEDRQSVLTKPKSRVPGSPEVSAYFVMGTPKQKV